MIIEYYLDLEVLLKQYLLKLFLILAKIQLSNNLVIKYTSLIVKVGEI